MKEPRWVVPFLRALERTGMARTAAEDAGVDYTTAYLDAACDAAIVKCQRTANQFLASAVAATVDPDALPDPDTSPLPKISIAEAIKIVQIGAAKAQREAPLNPFAEQAARMGPNEVDAVRERLLRKFKRLRERQRSEKLEQGWTLDEDQDEIVPPGWVKAPDEGAGA